MTQNGKSLQMMATGGAMYGMLGTISFKTVRLEKMPDLKASMK